jgi:hypothetical protein
MGYKVIYHLVNGLVVDQVIVIQDQVEGVLEMGNLVDQRN